MLNLTLPAEAELITPQPGEVLMGTNADLREPANVTCWPTQKQFEQRLETALETLGYRLRRAHPVNERRGHGFISSQKEGSELFAGIDPDAPIIVLLTAWQYSHHLAPSLVHHRGPILLLANFDGTWPGLVGMLCMAGCLTSLERNYSRLWSETFADEAFIRGLDTWLRDVHLSHKLGYLHPVAPSAPLLASEAGQIGVKVGQSILKRKAIVGLFDTFCMGMINGMFPQKAMIDVGMTVESLSQSALLVEMNKVPTDLREACLDWYETRGMRFRFGADGAKDLTREQVLEQCAMMIAMARFVKRFGLTAVGVQYQQGLKDSCAASDFAEGAIGNAERFPIPDENGEIVCPDAQISGAVPFAHLKGVIAGTTGYRQPAMFFRYGGSTIAGQGKAGRFIWARAHYEGTQVILHSGTGTAVELPHDEFERRRRATNYEWPLLNAVLDGVSRDDLMAGHQSNHLSLAYVEEEVLSEVLNAFIAQALTQNMKVFIAGDAHLLMK